MTKVKPEVERGKQSTSVCVPSLYPPPSPSPSLSLAVRGAGVRLLVYLKLKVSKQQGGVRDISHTTQY